MGQFHATTICAVKKGDEVCIGGDGQVTMGETAIMKNGAKKVKKIYKNTVLSGFAGSVNRRLPLRGGCRRRVCAQRNAPSSPRTEQGNNSPQRG